MHPLRPAGLAEEVRNVRDALQASWAGYALCSTARLGGCMDEASALAAIDLAGVADGRRAADANSIFGKETQHLTTPATMTQPLDPEATIELGSLMPQLQRVMPPRYQLEKSLGDGAMGVVFLATDHTLGRKVAIKLSKLLADSRRQEREARSLAAVDSPHVVRVFDFVRLSDAQACLVMEYVPGEDLRRLLTRSGPQEVLLTQKWMVQVARGMADVGLHGVVHRDLKPANILVNQRLDAFVTDFGLAQTIDSSRSIDGGRIVGTPLYIAPEQVEDPRNVDVRADIYSYGATFYHLLTGAPPFESESLVDLLLKHKIEPLAPPQSRREVVPGQLNDCIERCLAKKPVDRFQDFEEVEQALSSQHPNSPWNPVPDEQCRPLLEQYRTHRSQLLDDWGASSVTLQLPRGRTLTILRGNLVTQEVSAIVSSDDGALTMSGGVSAAIRQRAGEQLVQDAARFVPARQGRVVVTPGGRLTAKYVFHGITIGVEQGRLQMPSRDIIAEIVDSCLYHAETYSVRSIAFPLLGSGSGRLDRGTALDAIVEVLCRRLVHQPTPLTDVRVVLFS